MIRARIRSLFFAVLRLRASRLRQLIHLVIGDVRFFSLPQLLPAVVVAVGLFGRVALAVDGNWDVNAAGNWSTANNWTSKPSVPGGAASTVGLTNNINSARIVTIDTTSRTVGILNIGDTNNNNSFTLAASGGASLIFNNSSANAQLNQVSGSNGDTVSAPISLSDNLVVANADNSLLTISGPVTSSGTKNLTLNANSTGGITLSTGGVNITGTITNSGSAAGISTISGVIGTNVTNVIQNSATSQLTLSGANTFTGLTSITAGKLLYGASNVISTGGVTVNGATAILDLANNQSDSVGTVTLDGSGSINGTGTSALTSTGFEMKSGSVGAILAGSGIALNKTTAGTVTLSGVNTYTGATTITAGNLVVNGSIASGSTVGVATAGTLSGIGTINGNATLNGNGIFNFTNPGKISGTLGATGGNWNGNGSVTGLTTASSGTFTIGTGANFTADGNLDVTGGSIAAGNSASTITGSVNYTSGTSSSFAGVIAGAGKTLTLNNAAATLTLGGINSYTGVTTITAGDLEVNGSIAAGSTLNIATGGTLSGNGTINGNVTLTGNGVIDLKNPATIGGTLAVTGGNWNGHGSVAGLVTSSSGTFTIGAGGHLTADGGVNVTGGTIVLAAPSSKIKGNVNYTSSSNSTLGGIVEGSGSTLTLNNAAAVLTLNGTNTYTGATTINAGTLSLESGGSLTSAVSVLVGTLTGAGSTTGAVTIGNGSGGNDAFISPGNSPGTITTSSALSLLLDATYSFELNSGLLTADMIVANGVSIDGATFSITDLGAATLSPGTFFTAIDNTSGGAITGTLFTNLPQGGTITAGANTFLANYSGGNGNDLVLMVVPEPGSSFLLLIGSFAIGFVWRLRRRTARSRLY